MFPKSGFDKIQRITIPECMQCKALWQDAEDEFRSFMALPAAHLNEHAIEQWDGPISRAHNRKEDGKQRVHAIATRTIEKEDASEGEQFRLMPHLSDKVNLTIRKMVRGLCYYHGLATEVADHHVLSNLHPNAPITSSKPIEFDYLPGVFRYCYYDLLENDDSVHVHWLLTFYDTVSFIGMVSTNRDVGWQANNSQHRDTIR